jgi:putative redox protein
MTEQLAITVNLANEKVQFTGAVRSNAEITMDYTPPLGDGLGYTPLELVLMSLATCSGATVATLLRRMRKDVSGLQVSARGTRRDTHPTSFQQISLEFVLNSADAEAGDVQKAIQLSEETYCPVWAMLKTTVEITPQYKIIAASED